MRLTVKRVGYVLLLAFLLGQMLTAGVTVRAATNVLYVAPTAQGTGDCSSWANACTLTTALQQAQSGDEIWVKEGTYKPDTTGLTDPRTATFQLKTGVAVYGGFAGTEISRYQRDWQAHPTILSGDIGTANDNSDNVYHVVTGADSATLDGFTITGGNANGRVSEYPTSRGGGMYNDGSSPTLRNVIFSNNVASYYGGGMYNTNGSNPSLTNVTFSNNTTRYGGGMYNDGSSPSLTDVTFDSNMGYYAGGGIYNTNGSSPSLTSVTFRQNSAMNYDGGGVYNDGSSPTLTNVTFSQNSAGWKGGGVYNFNSSPTLTNVTFSNNSADNSGGGMYNYNSSSPTLTNVLIAGSSTHGGDCANDDTSSLNANSKNNLIDDSAYACGLTDGTNGNIIGHDAKVGPLGNYGGETQTVPLLPDSPAIDAGDSTACPATDQRGVPRPQGNGCDIGAYEREDFTAPRVLDVQGTVSAGSTFLVEGAVAHQSFSQLTVRFSEAVYNPAGNTDPEDVTNPANYLLLRDNGDGFQTTSCAAGVTGGDIAVPITAVTYDDHGGAGPFDATLQLNGGVPLPNGRYRLLVCGTTSIVDLTFNHLAGDGVHPGTDFVRNFTIAATETLPSTGFAPGRVTLLPAQPVAKAYNNGLGLWLEIPSLGLQAPIVGVPQAGGQWDITWLGDEIGWLEGTAFPTWTGNAVLTGHVTDADGLPGPFAQLHTLRYDDAIIVHLAGQRYEFRVREVRLVRPNDTRYALKHLTGYPYLTLVTCRGYDPAKDTYHWRWIVRAVLVSVTPDGN